MEMNDNELFYIGSENQISTIGLGSLISSKIVSHLQVFWNTCICSHYFTITSDVQLQGDHGHSSESGNPQPVISQTMHVIVLFIEDEMITNFEGNDLMDDEICNDKDPSRIGRSKSKYSIQ